MHLLDAGLTRWILAKSACGGGIHTLHDKFIVDIWCALVKVLEEALRLIDTIWRLKQHCIPTCLLNVPEQLTAMVIRFHKIWSHLWNGSHHFFELHVGLVASSNQWANSDIGYTRCLQHKYSTSLEHTKIVVSAEVGSKRISSNASAIEDVSRTSVLSPKIPWFVAHTAAVVDINKFDGCLIISCLFLSSRRSSIRVIDSVDQ
jgi:hypothetical protein